MTSAGGSKAVRTSLDAVEFVGLRVDARRRVQVRVLDVARFARSHDGTAEVKVCYRRHDTAGQDHVAVGRGDEEGERHFGIRTRGALVVTRKRRAVGGSMDVHLLLGVALSNCAEL